MDLIKLSSSFYESGDGKHQLRYSRETSYLVCNCAESAAGTPCAYAVELRSRFEAAGIPVKFKKASTPIFIKEIDRFRKTIRDTLNEFGDTLKL